MVLCSVTNAQDIDTSVMYSLEIFAGTTYSFKNNWDNTFGARLGFGNSKYYASVGVDYSKYYLGTIVENGERHYLYETLLNYTTLGAIRVKGNNTLILFAGGGLSYSISSREVGPYDESIYEELYCPEIMLRLETKIYRNFSVTFSNFIRVVKLRRAYYNANVGLLLKI